MTFRELFGVELPVVQAPMAGSQGSALAIAVASAGGLGSLPAAMLSTDVLLKELAAIRSATAAPFNVNFFCHTPPPMDAADDAAMARFREALAPYYAELGVDPSASPAGPSRAPFSAELAAALASAPPRIVSFHFGLPAPELLAVVRGWGSLILASATTVDEARWLEARGVDAIIAQGSEAGGHRGMFLDADPSYQLGTMALVRQIAVTTRVPVIAAGGIADAAGLAAARALGAIGVQVGTAFLPCPEATTSAVHRSALASEAARTTAITNVFSGRPARGIVNRLMRELGPMSALAPAFPLASALTGPLRAAAEKRGDGGFSPLWAGQAAALARAIPAADVTRAIAGV